MSKSENFAELLEQSFKAISKEGTVVKGTVVEVGRENVLVDVGLKSEGRVPLREFGAQAELRAGDVVEVYLERMENKEGEVVLSREKARREEAWEILEESYQKKEQVTGSIVGRVRGGFTVELSGVIAFLPTSQIDVRFTRETPMPFNVEQPFVILKMDRLRGNIVVSRRAILEESQIESRNELLATLAEGKELEGTVKNITDYGAFIDLGGLDGLLHVTDISWNRVSHPSDVLKVGQVVQVKVIKVGENNRISLGMKQLEPDPWTSVADQYIAGAQIEGTVSNIMDYGVFVLLQPGIEGLIHASELSWTKKNLHPSKIVALGDKVSVKVLEVDPEKRRISLSLRQCQQNPWMQFVEEHPIGSVVEGEVKNFTEFGMFVGLPQGIDGMVHINDVTWDSHTDGVLESFEKGSMIKVKVLDAAPEKERISLGIKQLSQDPLDNLESAKMGDVITCTVQEVTPQGIQVVTDKGVSTFIRKADLAKERSEQKPERFAVDERVDAQVVAFDKKVRKFTLSIKAREIAEERQAMAEYGSSDSGASLGDILGAAIDLKGSEKKTSEKVVSEKKPAAKKKAKKVEDEEKSDASV